MRSTPMTTPMLTLPGDAFSEIALRLPAVKSTKPWRDENSLAITCKVLCYWKKTVIDKNIEVEWKRVNTEVDKTAGWRDALEKILSDFDDPSRRLFREPILRKIASKRLDSDSNKQIKNFDLYVTMLYSMLETISYKDIRQLLDVFNNASLNTKTQIVSVLPLFLPALASNSRQQVLCQLFKLVDTDPALRSQLVNCGTFNAIGYSLGEDHQSKILLILSLYSRKLFSLRSIDAVDFIDSDDSDDSDDSVYSDQYYYPGYSDEDEVALNLIPDNERWSWLFDKVPEYLETTHGLHTLLDDPACRIQMINYLDNSFLKCRDDKERFNFCEKISEFYPKICKCRDGAKLTDKLVHWFLKTPELRITENGPLSSRFIGLLGKHIAMYKTSLGKIGKILLTEKISKIISYVIQINAFYQSTALLIEMVKVDKKLITTICENLFDLTNKNALIHAIQGVNSLKDLDSRYHYVAALCVAARHHRHSDSKFFNSFLDIRNAILRKM